MILFSGFNAKYKCVTTALLDLYAKLGRLEDSSTIAWRGQQFLLLMPLMVMEVTQ
ncbi:unnamed protein product, partial [Thlaspi arvense]